ncbi:MAG: hypothetical protein MZW92_51735 [Comamonadaceae bacterium]|nr:hypothetical protein [Comamonadaceae bacterium]
MPRASRSSSTSLPGVQRFGQLRQRARPYRLRPRQHHGATTGGDHRQDRLRRAAADRSNWRSRGMTCAACATRASRRCSTACRAWRPRSTSPPRPRRCATRPALADADALIAAVKRAGFAARRRPAPHRARRSAPASAPPTRRELRRFWISAALTLPLMAPDVLHVRRRATPRTTCCRAGCNWRWPRRCSSGSAGASTSAPATRCAAAPATWTCWWRSAPAWPTSTAWR